MEELLNEIVPAADLEVIIGYISINGIGRTLVHDTAHTHTHSTIPRMTHTSCAHTQAIRNNM